MKNKTTLIILLMFTSISIYSQKPCPGVSTVLYQGKNYNTVLIGSQCWLKENLDIGNMILATENASNNNYIEKYCLNNDLKNCNTYGGLYQWNEAMVYSKTPGAKGICPDNWHIPTAEEFMTLMTAVGYSSNALISGTGTNINTSGFSALMAGDRSDDTNFFKIGTYFWASTELMLNNANILNINDDGKDGVYLYYTTKEHGFSIRCIKNDNSTSLKVSNEEEFPDKFLLTQNYPNPFNPATSINFSIPKTLFVSIKVYNVLGNEVAVIVSETKSAGNYKVEFNAGNLVSGIYFYKFQTGNFSETKRLIIMK